MTRTVINISDYSFLVEHYDATVKEDYKETHNISNKYLFLRSYDFINNVANDKVIFILSLNDFELIQNEVKQGKDLNDIIVFPSGEDISNIFSRSYYNFNNNYTKHSFYNSPKDNNIEIDNDGCFFTDYDKYKELLSGNGVYPILSVNVIKDEDTNENKVKTYTLANIKTDVIRIYHPQNKIDIDAFVCIENYINNIHFIYICKQLSEFTIDSQDERSYGHVVYSEYRKILIPNIYSLFNDNTYFIEDLNDVDVISSVNNSYLAKNNYRYIGFNNTYNKVSQFLSMKLLTQPWRLDSFIHIDDNNDDIYDTDNILYKKTFIYEFFKENSLSYPLTITIYPYSDTSENRSLDSTPEYILSNELEPSSTVLQTHYSFDIQAMISFNDDEGSEYALNEPIIHTEFIYPTISGCESIEDTYCKYYHIPDKTIYNKKNYITTLDEAATELMNKLEYLQSIKLDGSGQSEVLHAQVNKLSIYDRKSISMELKEKGLPETDLNILKMYYKLQIAAIQNTDEINTNEDIDFVGYKIDIASDTLFKNIIYTNYQTPIKRVLAEDEANAYNESLPNAKHEGDPVYWSEPDISIYNELLDRYRETATQIPQENDYDAPVNTQPPHTSTGTQEYYQSPTHTSVQTPTQTMTPVQTYEYVTNDMVKYYLSKNEANELNAQLPGAKHAGDPVLDDDIGISNFNFSINGIFSNWKELPELLVCRTYFIDKFIGTYLISNTIIITKELFKYLVNDNNKYRFKSLYKQWNKNIQENNMKVIHSSDTTFNFIDKINCIVDKAKDDSINSSLLAGGNKGTHIMYKPVFFKVNVKETIELRQNITQNIALNLYTLLSKVDNFTIVIEGNTFNESARNNNYVIFNINASLINGDSGLYDLYGDGNYIDTYNWYTK